MKNFILEIYVENIPSRFITQACSQMEKFSLDFLKAKNLSFTSIKTYGTYRRLILNIEGIPLKTEERIERFYGPSKKILKDEKGNYTKQAIGFASSHKTTPDKLGSAVIEKKGEVLFVEKKINSISANKILSEMIIDLIKNIKFPKTMVWEESKLVFARPIRNILAIYGNSLISLKIAQIKSSKTTYGLGSMGFKKINIKSADLYFKILEKNNVIVKDENRKESLLKEFKNLESSMKFIIEKDENLIEENVYITEHPTCVPVKYPNEFLNLPEELISLVMKKQLKFFPCYKDKKLFPYFVGIRDGLSRGQRNVEEGFLNVFEARSRDAMFFYENDQKLKKEELEKKLENIVFQEKLGTMLDKNKRIVSLVGFLSENLKKDKEDLNKMASCVYLDLLTSVVKEFPELQGTMSSYYGKYWGLNDTLSKELSMFYWPVNSSDKIPQTLKSSILSLAGKIDTISGDFLIDLIPNGSQDPHGLRRQAYGIVRIILENNIHLNLRELFDFSLSSFNNLNFDKEKVILELLNFIFQRFESYLIENKFNIGLINSIKNIFLKEGSLILSYERIKALKEISKLGDFEILSLLYKRVKNILKNEKNNFELNENLFEKDIEKKLLEVIKEIKEKNESFLVSSKFLEAFHSILLLNIPLEKFFNEVLVMVENEKIKNNRLALIKQVYELFEYLADISKIQSV